MGGRWCVTSGGWQWRARWARRTRRRRDTESKTRTLHKDVGKNQVLLYLSSNQATMYHYMPFLWPSDSASSGPNHQAVCSGTGSIGVAKCHGSSSSLSSWSSPSSSSCSSLSPYFHHDIMIITITPIKYSHNFKGNATFFGQHHSQNWKKGKTCGFSYRFPFIHGTWRVSAGSGFSSLSDSMGGPPDQPIDVRSQQKEATNPTE